MKYEGWENERMLKIIFFLKVVWPDGGARFENDHTSIHSDEIWSTLLSEAIRVLSKS